jgi:hypothetical protein
MNQALEQVSGQTRRPPAWMFWGRWLGLALLAFCLVCMVAGWPSKLVGTPDDTSVYIEAGNRMRAGTNDLYAPPSDGFNIIGSYTYPPTFAALFAPLTFFDRPVTQFLWRLVLAACALAAGVCLFRLFEIRKLAHGRDFAFAVAAACIGPLILDISWGNANLPVAACIAAGLLCLERGRPIAGGAWLALAAQLKVIPIVLFAVLVLQRRFKAAAAMLGVMALFYFLPLIWFVPAMGVSEGVARNHEAARAFIFDQALSRASKQDVSNVGSTAISNSSFYAVSQRLFVDGAPTLAMVWSDEWLPGQGPLLFALDPAFVRWLGLPPAILLFGVALWAAWKLRRDVYARSAAFGLALLPALLGNLLCWGYSLVHVGLLFAPLAALRIKEGRAPRAYFFAGLALFLSCGLVFTGYDLMEYLQMLGVPVWGALAAWAMVLITLLRREKQTTSTSES